MKFGLSSTDPELERLQRGFAAGALVIQTQYILACVKRGRICPRGLPLGLEAYEISKSSK